MGTVSRDHGMNLCSDHYTSTPRPWYATHIEEDNVGLGGIPKVTTPTITLYLYKPNEYKIVGILFA